MLAGERACQQTQLGELVEQPVVERALVLELERADRVGDVLQRVLDRVREGVHRVDAPAVAGIVVRGAADAVDGRIAQIDVGRGHVDLRAQHHRAVGVPAVAHLAQAREVLLGRAGAEGAVGAGRGEVAAAGAHGFRRLLVDIGVAGLDQRLGRAVHEVEVVAGVVEMALGLAFERRFPAEAQPLHRVEDGVDIFLLLLLRIGVVEAHVADAAIVARQAEVQADALGVADMQVAVGLGREAGADLRRIGLALAVVRAVAGRAGPAAAGVAALLEIALDDRAQEVAGLVFRAGAVGGGVVRVAHEVRQAGQRRAGSRRQGRAAAGAPLRDRSIVASAAGRDRCGDRRARSARDGLTGAGDGGVLRRACAACCAAGIEKTRKCPAGNGTFSIPGSGGCR